MALKNTDSYTIWSVHKNKTSQLLRRSTTIPGTRSERTFSLGSSQRVANHILNHILQDVQRWGSQGCLLAFLCVGWWHEAKAEIHGASLQGAKSRQPRCAILGWSVLIQKGHLEILEESCNSTPFRCRAL